MSTSQLCQDQLKRRLEKLVTRPEHAERVTARIKANSADQPPDYKWLDRLPVKVGLSTLDKPMTRDAAQRYGDKHMPRDLKRAGFKTVIAKSDAELHGGVWFRINYGK